MTRTEKVRAFRALHARDGAFVIPNPWNAGTARILAAMGFEALATTSAGYAFSVGKRDSSAGLTRDEVIANARHIAEATDLPVNGDLEDGFGAAPEDCARTIAMAAEAGLAGGSIEDATGNPGEPIFPFAKAVERIEAAVEAAREHDVVLTARAENFLHGRPDLDDTIARLKSFEAAGAEVLYAPGLPDLDAIRAVCRAVERPVNVVMGLTGLGTTVAELEAAGVTRISVGGSFARAALGAFVRAAEEVRDRGTFGYAANAVPDSAMAALVSNRPR